MYPSKLRIASAVFTFLFLFSLIFPFWAEAVDLHSLASSTVTQTVKIADTSLLYGKYALGSEENATLVSDCIIAKHPNFWIIAFSIIETFHNSIEIKRNLEYGAEKMGSAFWGGYSTHLEKCSSEVEQYLNNPDTPSQVKPWLESLVEHFRKKAERESEAEDNEDIER